jgi:hypothetical protein
VRARVSGIRRALAAGGGGGPALARPFSLGRPDSHAGARPLDGPLAR